MKREPKPKRLQTSYLVGSSENPCHRKHARGLRRSTYRDSFRDPDPTHRENKSKALNRHPATHERAPRVNVEKR